MLHQFFSIFTGLHAVDFAVAKSTTKSSGSAIYIILLVIIVIAYLWIRPQRKRMRQQQMDQRQFEVGDEVVTTGGIVGRVVARDTNRVDLEIAPGTVIQVVPQAIARREIPPAPNNEGMSDFGYDHDHDIDHDHDHDHGHEPDDQGENS